MGSEKRQRQRENRMRALAEAERAKQRSRTSRRVLWIVLAVVGVLGALWLWSIISGGDDSGDDLFVSTDPQTTEADMFQTEEPDQTGLTDDPADGAPVDPADEPAGNPDDALSDSPGDSPDETVAGSSEQGSSEQGSSEQAPLRPGCPAEDGSEAPRTQFDQEHPICIDAETHYAAAFETSMGSFTMVLDPALDLVSVNNFVVLGRWHAFDGTLFHRVIPDFVIQGGDVEHQYGTGGPGYRFTGGFPEENWYRIGSVAMANAGSPATNGSQFFVITGPNGAALPPLYSPLGHVIDGMDVVHAIEAVSTGEGDAPLDEVVMTTVTMSEATQAQIDAYQAARS